MLSVAGGREGGMEGWRERKREGQGGEGERDQSGAKTNKTQRHTLTHTNSTFEFKKAGVPGAQRQPRIDKE